MKLRRPTGLVLAGGGALGAWQAGFLSRLSERGVEFDHVLGISIGALNGAAYCLGKEELLSRLWCDPALKRFLRPAPKFLPFSLLSNEPVRALLRDLADGGAARARRALTVVSLCLEELRPVYARLAPEGPGWSADFRESLLASCAIPGVFPPVRAEIGGRMRTLVDGGVPGIEPLSLASLSGCADILVLEMMRPEELGRRRWLWPYTFDQLARETMRRLVDRGLEDLRRDRPGLGAFRAVPSRVLSFNMLCFFPGYCGPAFALGQGDADAFLCA